MVVKAVKGMKSGKAPGPSGLVIEMIHTSREACLELMTDLINVIITFQTVPCDWNESYILNLFKGKGCALDRGLKLTELLSKILERVLDHLIREVVDIDSIQFGFMPGRGTTDAICIARQLQEKHLAKIFIRYC